ncbi:MAG: type-F conjugative transfer system secretin TraK [Rickettsiales bacterium]
MSLKEIFIASLISIAAFKGENASASESQKFSVSNNSSFVATISEKELTRIIFEGDVVEGLFSTNGEFTHEISGSDLYIKPTVNKPINFFVKTEKGNNYKVILTSKDIPSVQIFVKNTDIKTSSKKEREGHFSEECNFRKRLSQIISAVLADDESVGFKKKNILKTVSKRRASISQYHDSNWEGKGVAASKYYLENLSVHQVAFINRETYLTDDLDAVYLEKEKLNPGEETVLITIKRR